MENTSTETGDVKKKEIAYHPEKCVGCLLCASVCSLLYDKRVNPLKARIKIVRKNYITSKIYTTPECTFCGQCAEICSYEALELIKHAS